MTYMIRLASERMNLNVCTATRERVRGGKGERDEVKRVVGWGCRECACVLEVRESSQAVGVVRMRVRVRVRMLKQPK